MEEMTWEQVLARDDIVGGDLETQEGGAVYRGPISEIKMEDSMVVFYSAWVAKMSMSAPGEWEKWDITTLRVNAELATPRDIGDGRIMFMMPMVGPAVIFLKGGSQLDPAKVKGLEV